MESDARRTGVGEKIHDTLEITNNSGRDMLFAVSVSSGDEQCAVDISL